MRLIGYITVICLIVYFANSLMDEPTSISEQVIHGEADLTNHTATDFEEKHEEVLDHHEGSEADDSVYKVASVLENVIRGLFELIFYILHRVVYTFF
ncbi:hypothetical protein [Halalkalibacillus halophilus]|uniref:hypothetical protein n=1 Tax=Halalkalibacillus halophilus TaxID=392827 RepID=UPI00041F1319|nr:hypothetical protein [Halalkalibacillus halophilus]